MRSVVIDSAADLVVLMAGAIIGGASAWALGVHAILGGTSGAIVAFVAWRAFDVDRW